MELTVTDTINILLVDDHALVRESLALRLNAESDLKVVATANDAGHALQQADGLDIDVVLMDINMPGLSCFDAAARLNNMFDNVRVIFLSAYWNDNYIEQALDAKACGFITKAEAPGKVIDAIREVAGGGVVFSNEVKDRIAIEGHDIRLANANKSRLSRLSTREMEVLRYLARGLTRKQIGKTMHISEKTVANHTTHLMAKLDIHDRVDLTRFAIREGISQV